MAPQARQRADAVAAAVPCREEAEARPQSHRVALVRWLPVLAPLPRRCRLSGNLSRPRDGLARPRRACSTEAEGGHLTEHQPENPSASAQEVPQEAPQEAQRLRGGSAQKRRPHPNRADPPDPMCCPAPRLAALAHPQVRTTSADR